MKNIFNSLLFLLMGILATILLLEFSLRGLGWFFDQSHVGYDFNNSRDYYRILAYGASFTAGIGVERKQTYPVQLDKLLNNSHDQKKFRVINRSIVGRNTSQLKENLSDYLRSIKPQLVIFEGGKANILNHWGYEESLNEKTIIGSLYKTFFEIRLVRLISFLFQAVVPSTLKKENLTLLDKYRKNINGKVVDKLMLLGTPEEFESHLEIRKSKGIDLDKKLFLLAYYYYLHTNYSAVWKTLEKIRSHNDKFPSYYWLAGVMHHEFGEYEKSLETFREGYDIDQNDVRLIHGLVSANVVLKNAKEVKKWLALLPPEERGTVFFQTTASASSFKAWIEKDLRDIADLVKKSNSQLLLQTYPIYDYGEEWLRTHGKGAALANEVYAQLSAEGFWVVDHQKVFKRMWAEGKNEGKYFLDDGHPSGLGYAVMAQDLFAEIKKKGLVEQ